MKRAIAVWSLCLGVSVPTIGTARAEIDFNRQIRPVLADTCFECHGPDEHSRKADLRLDILDEAIGNVILPGDADNSLFMELIRSHDSSERMPPPKSPRQLTEEQVELLAQWIDEGASFNPHWAFVPPKATLPPSIEDSDHWPRNGIDHWVEAHLDRKGWTPSADADPGVLARRLGLALTGLPVPDTRRDQFLQQYASNPDQAIDQLADDLLSSSAFGEHLAWVWMDAARYADTNGYQGDAPRVMWPWRDWLVDALNRNLPFDHMTEQMLAGDLLVPDHLQGWDTADWIENDEASRLVTATGFLRNHRFDSGSGTIPEESKFENAADRMETVGTVWMGLTMQCARCHTHKFDPIENREYYELISFFDKIPEQGSALKNASHPYIHTPIDKDRRELKALKSEFDRAEQAFVNACQGIETSQRSWEASLAESNSAPKPRVSRNLAHRYVADGMTLDGNTTKEESNDPIKLCAGNQEWTISFWFKPTSNDQGAIFSSVQEPERYRQGIQADWIDGKIRVRHVCRWVNSYIEFESAIPLELDRWHHVTFRSDGRMQGLGYRASLNGDDAAMHCTHPVTNDSANTAGEEKLLLGGSPLLKGAKGELRDLRFYDRFIAPEEVASLAEPRSLAELAAIPEGARSETERTILRFAFLESDALPEAVKKRQAKWHAAEAALTEAIKQTPTTMVMQERLTEPTHMRAMGVYDQLTEAVSSGTPAVLPPIEAESPDRLDLARWLTSDDHPLTARVAVNRLWQLVWGRGFVDTPDNFGTQAPEPVHDELLDWLANEYVRLDWDTKALLKLIVTSRTYRQDSAAPRERWKKDPANRHLARGPRFRLPVHIVRDQALALAGRMDDTMGGPPVLLDKVKGKDGKAVNLPYEINDRRRTLYTFWKRNAPHPMLAVFDVADRNQCDVRVRRTNTPLQALVTLNEPGLAAAAADLGQRAQATSDDPREQLRWIWTACTGRAPDPITLDRLETSLRDYRELANSSDDQAWTTLANTLLNLDVTLSLE